MKELARSDPAIQRRGAGADQQALRRGDGRGEDAGAEGNLTAPAGPDPTGPDPTGPDPTGPDSDGPRSDGCRFDRRRSAGPGSADPKQPGGPAPARRANGIALAATAL